MTDWSSSSVVVALANAGANAFLGVGLHIQIRGWPQNEQIWTYMDVSVSDAAPS